MRKMPFFYTKDQYKTFMNCVDNQQHHDLYEILFGSGCRISELLGETRKRCITCKFLTRELDQKSGRRKPTCTLTKLPLPKSPRRYVCEKHEQLHPGLSVEDVNLEAGTIRIIGKGQVERVAVLSSKATEALRRFIGQQTSGKIEFDIGIRRLEQLTRIYVKKAGLPESDKNGRWSPHKMRHSHLTFLVESARELGEGEATLLAKEQAGHKNIETTQIYLHTGTDTRRRVIDKAFQ